MKPWLLYSLLAMVCWGSYIVVAKVATSPEYGGLSPRLSALLMYGGIGLTFVIYWFLGGAAGRELNSWSTLAGISAGVLWGLGMVFSLCAVASGADVARLAPIYNCNTLVAVLLGIVVLKEIHGGWDIVRVVVASVLIVVGGVLVAR
jgi:glucose uptake protein GlcU